MKTAHLDSMFDVRGKTALVTGGASGIGLAMAEILAEGGARVVILDMNPDTLKHQTKRLQELGLDVKGEILDVTDSEATDIVFDDVAKRYGGIDITFANAGMDPGPGFVSFADGGSRPPEFAIENYSNERWHKIISVSLDAVFYAIRASARHMRPNKSGSIIVTTSISAVRPAPAVGAAYMAAKAGAAHLVRTFALELAADNIRVNAIAPGPFITNINDGALQKKETRDIFAKMVPLGRIAHTDEMKGLALFLASPASGYVTGQQIVIDGGTSLSAPRS